MLKMGGLYVQVGRGPRADDVRASALPYTGWAGFNSEPRPAAAAVKELLLHCAKNDIRAGLHRRPRRASACSIYSRRSTGKSRSRGRRWVVSHVNVISPRDIERIARLGLVLTTHTNAYLYKSLERHAKT